MNNSAESNVGVEKTIAALRGLAIRGLVRMYVPEERRFVFCLRKGANGVAPEGRSRRYAAMTLVGLAGESAETVSQVLHGHSLHDVCGQLIEDAVKGDNIGDVGVATWAAKAVGYPDRSKLWRRLLELKPVEGVHPTVEVSWCLVAATLDSENAPADLARQIAARLVAAQGATSNIFPHVLGGGASRSHVSCFADMVYPIHSLSNYARVTGDKAALAAAARGAKHVCDALGPDGQWWWHYDYRTGRVLEGYPVYAVHQDSMAPMCLFALHEAGGPDYSAAIYKGLEWLWHSPEINASLIDTGADLIWRKVARREPNKFSRYAQAAASLLHPSLRVPGLGALFRPGSIDFEDRPYHLGWVLYAFPPARAARWDGGGRGA